MHACPRSLESGLWAKLNDETTLGALELDGLVWKACSQLGLRTGVVVIRVV